MNNAGLRVLVLTSLFPNEPGEKEGNFVLDQVRALAETGLDLTVLVARPWAPFGTQGFVSKNKLPVEPKKYSGERFRIENASYFSLPRYALGKYAAGYVIRGVLPKALALGSKHPFDIIHAHGFSMGAVAAELSARTGKPYVLTIHGIETAPRFDDMEEKRRRIASVIERASAVVLVGSPLLEYCRKYTPKSEHCVVVGNGFTSYDGLTPSARITHRRPLRVVAVSNYGESKGFELLVEALADPDLRDCMEAVLVGGGTGFSRVRQLAAQIGIDDAVHFTGLLPHRDALSEVAAGDVFCLPSWREAFGIMYAEAMALGKITIGCRGQGPSDFIGDGETGLLIEPRSSRAVRDALRWVLTNRDEADRIAKNGRDFSLSSLTWAQNANRIQSLYRKLISASAGVSR